MENYTLSDIAAVSDRNDNGLFSGGAGGILALIIVFILLFGRGGFGNGCGEPATQGDLQRGFDTNTIINKLDGLNNGICDSTFALNNTVNSGFNGVNMGITQLGYNMQNCCCEIQRNADHNTQLILDKLCQNEINCLRDRLETANSALTAQTLANNVINAVRPMPQPAWITCSPYQAASFNGCNCAAGV